MLSLPGHFVVVFLMLPTVCVLLAMLSLILWLFLSLHHCCPFARALDQRRGRKMRLLSLRPGEAAVLAQALALWAVDACVYTIQEVRTKGRSLSPHYIILVLGSSGRKLCDADE